MVGRLFVKKAFAVYMALLLVMGSFVCVVARPDIPQCKAEVEAVPRVVISSDTSALGATSVIAADITANSRSIHQIQPPVAINICGNHGGCPVRTRV